MAKESDFIQLAQSFFKQHNRIKLGPGDDAAIISEISTNDLVVSVDALIENVHFESHWLEYEDMGYRALAASLSDLAAMGARPLTFFVNLELPTDIEIDEVREIMQGMSVLGEKFCISPAGGNFTASDRIGIVTTVVGEVPKDGYIARCCAEEGDIIAITGEVGIVESAIRLFKVYNLASKIDHKLRSAAIMKFRRPMPRFEIIEKVRRVIKPRASIDISDGLSSDLFKLAEKADLEAVIYEELMPMPEVVKAVANEVGVDPWKIALSSGEEFELILVMPPEDFKKLQSEGIELIKIGEFRPTFRPTVKFVKTNGREIDYIKGFEHFSYL